MSALNLRSAAASQAAKRRRISPDLGRASTGSASRPIKLEDEDIAGAKDEKPSPPLKRTKLTPMRTAKLTHAKDVATCQPADQPKELYETAGSGWEDWPAPRGTMAEAREWVKAAANGRKKVLLVPDKDADGLTAGYVMHKTLELLGLPANDIFVHVLSKGTNVHSASERETIESLIKREDIERVVVLDQGSRPGPIVGTLPVGSEAQAKPMLLIDHHQSTEFPPESLVLTACNTSPIATTSLLTYILCQPLHPSVQAKTDWAALMGVIGDLGPGIKWGKGAEGPWPAHIGTTSKRYGAKVLADAVGAINAPRRTAEYNVKRAWQILLEANQPSDVSRNAWLKLCRLDVNDEIERWARRPPRFSADGAVALIRVESGFQIHPVIATRWAGTLRKARTLKMVMCANTAFNPDPNKVSFSCRISASLRELPEFERPDLIDMLKSYGNSIDGFRERVGDDFARGHKEATGGIIARDEFEKLLLAMGIDESAPRGGGGSKTSPAKPTGKKVIDPGMATSKPIDSFFKAKAPKQEASNVK